MIDLILGDCMDVMKSYDDNHFDLCISDPPYGINVTSMNMGSRKTVKPDKTKKWDITIPDANYFLELKRISKNQIIWGGNYFNLPPSRCWVIWDKGETMYGRDFAEAEMAWTSFDKVVRLIKLNPTQLDRIHTCQKPIKLYRWLLENYAQKGQLILDTHLGSGSSAIAAHYFGVDFVGCEIDKDYYDAAVKRFNRETKQIAMF